MSKRNYHKTFHEHYYDDDRKPTSSSGGSRATSKKAPSSSSSNTRDDPEEELKKREIADDPMLEYFRDKERKDKGLPSKPVYKGPFPPNRYNIRPGHRWDGVDRSNGYETKLLDKESSKKLKEEQEYRSATRDL